MYQYGLYECFYPSKTSIMILDLSKSVFDVIIHLSLE